MTDTLELRLAKWLIEQEPQLMAADEDTVTRVSAALAQNLGCQLGTVRARRGDAVYQEVMKQLGGVIHQNAVMIEAATRAAAPAPAAQ